MKVSILSMLSGKFDPYWMEFERGAEAARKNFDIELDLMTPDLAGGSEREITNWQLRKASEISLDKTVAAAGVAFLNYTRAKEAVNSIVNAGPPVVTFDTDCPASKRSFFIGTNNIAAASACAYTLAKHIAFKGKIVIFTPCDYVQSCIDRIAGFREVMSRYPGIEIIREAVGDENENAMRQKAEEIISTPGLTGVFCASGTAAAAVAELVEKKGLSGKIKIVSIDVNDSVIKYINNETISMAVAQRPYSMGFRLMDYLYQIARNGIETVLRGIPKSNMVDTGIHQVAKQNVANYLEMIRKSERSE